MTVKELKEMLDNYSDDLQVGTAYDGGYYLLWEEDLYIIQGTLENQEIRLTDPKATVTKEFKEKQFLCIQAD